MRRVSLNARTAFQAFSTDAVEVALLHIDHPMLDAPVRLSTDPTERLSTDPLAYGTRSAWMGSDPANDPYLFIVASANLPGDLEDAPAEAEIVLDNLDLRMAEVLRSFTDPPTAAMAVVMSDTPDVIEIEYQGMLMTSGGGTVSEITFRLSREPIEDEAFPKDRFTQDRFPALFS